MRERIQRSRPEPWYERKQEISSKWAIPFHRLEWLLGWVAWALERWAFLDVLERLSTFSILVVAIFYFAKSGDRLKQKHYQAWQVINTAQGQGGSGGRLEASAGSQPRPYFFDWRECGWRVSSRNSLGKGPAEPLRSAQ